MPAGGGRLAAALYVNLIFASIAVALAYMRVDRPDSRSPMDWAGTVLALRRGNVTRAGSRAVEAIRMGAARRT